MRHLRRLLRIFESHTRSLALVLYAGLAAAAYAGAWLLRFELAVPREYVAVFAWTLGPLLIIRIAAFRTFRLARERWRYAGPRDAARLLGACLSGSAVFWIVQSFLPVGRQVPLSVIAMECVLTGAFISASWLSYRLFVEHVRRGGGAALKRVVIIGAGDAGNMLAREMLRTPTGYTPVGFLDDDPRMRRRMVQGIEVFGTTADVQAAVHALQPDELVIAVPSASPSDLRRIVELCEGTGVAFKVLPGIAEVLKGDVSVQQLRPVRIEDLLGREPIELELPELAMDLREATVLITGAAGSIGSELARQVALHTPETLVLLDQAETDLFYLELELRERHPRLPIIPVVADVTDAHGVERVFRMFEPDRVFHAAAYKHVPMMECNGREAVRNNVIGTWRVADAAGRHGTGKFVLVSTDKAVRPANVMGATKRVAELTILDLQEQYPRTVFGAVRFGNVLGSNGSVIPVFRRQLAAGRPLTVTHPEMTRFFMTIPEAVQLILQASLMPAFRGNIAMLDMGEPVRIADMALNLLRLSGVPNGGERIVYTGLRPGEKLHEELIAPDETARSTDLPKVRIVETVASLPVSVSRQLLLWERWLGDGNDDAVVAALQHMVGGIGEPAGSPEGAATAIPSRPSASA